MKRLYHLVRRILGLPRRWSYGDPTDFILVYPSGLCVRPKFGSRWQCKPGFLTELRKHWFPI